MTGSRIFGPAIAAALIGPLGAGWLFILNGITFLAILWPLIMEGGFQVNVHGLLASTLDISDADFAAGRLKFAGRGGLVRHYLSGCCASGIHEALLGREEFGGEIIATNARYIDQEHGFLAAEIDFEWADADGDVLRPVPGAA